MTDIAHTPPLNATEAWRRLEEAAEVLRSKRAVARSLVNAEKQLLARLARQSGETSDHKRRDWALCSQEYTDFLPGLEAAQDEREAAQLKYDNLRTLAKLRQSEEATRRGLETRR